MKKLLVLVLLVSTILTGCSVEHMSFLEKTVYEENTETLEEDIEKTNIEVNKDDILTNISKGISEHFDFTKKTYGGIQYLDLVNRDESWSIHSGTYKSLSANEQMKFLRDVMLIINDSTENMQQIYKYCDKITTKYGYSNSDLVVNTNLLYESLQQVHFKESSCVSTMTKGTKVEISEFNPTKKQKKKYSALIKQLREGKVGETDYRSSTYGYIEDNCIYYTSYLYALNDDKNRLINSELFDEMTLISQKKFLMDICVIVNRQANLKYYGKNNQKELESAYKEYVLEIIKDDTGIDASAYMDEMWNGDTRKENVLD